MHFLPFLRRERFGKRLPELRRWFLSPAHPTEAQLERRRLSRQLSRQHNRQTSSRGFAFARGICCGDQIHPARAAVTRDSMPARSNASPATTAQSAFSPSVGRRVCRGDKINDSGNQGEWAFQLKKSAIRPLATCLPDNSPVSFPGWLSRLGSTPDSPRRFPWR